MRPFDLLFADPPYGKGLGEAALRSAFEGGWLAAEALCIVEESATALGPAGTVAPFGLVFADPPYGRGLAEKALASAREGGWLTPGALALIEDDAAAPEARVPGFAPIDMREISGTRITFLQSTG
jgi:16S rRNA G966 N2-methylase RsmD